jgi:hypothetical protein
VYVAPVWFESDGAEEVAGPGLGQAIVSPVDSIVYQVQSLGLSGRQHSPW